MERHLIPLLSEEDIKNEVTKDPFNVLFLENPSDELIWECVKRKPTLIAYLKDDNLSKELFDYACSLDAMALSECTPKRIKDRASYDQVKELLKVCGNKIRDIPGELITEELCQIAFPTITKHSVILDSFPEEAYTKEVVDYIFSQLDDFEIGLSDIPKRYLTKSRLLQILTKIEAKEGDAQKGAEFYGLDEFQERAFTSDVCDRLLRINVKTFNEFPPRIQSEYAEQVLPLYPRAIKHLVFPRTSEKKIDNYLKLNPHAIQYLEFKVTKERMLYACELDCTCFKYLPKEYVNKESTNKYCKLYFGNLAYAPTEYINSTFVLECLDLYLSNLIQKYDNEQMFTISNTLKKLNEKKIIDLKNNELTRIERKYGLRVPVSIYYDESLKLYFINEIAYGNPETNIISEKEMQSIKRTGVKLVEDKPDGHISDLDLINKSFPAEAVLHEIEEVKLSEREIRNSRFFYISDIHLDFKVESMFKPNQNIEIKNFIISLADKVVDRCKLRWTDWLFIAGDIGSVYEYNEIFLRELSSKLHCGRKPREYKNIAIVLGNHELWDFNKFADQSQNSKSKVDDVILKYRELCEGLRIYLLENDLLLIKNTNSYFIPNGFFDKIDSKHMEKYRRDVVAAIYGGVGFSGCAQLFNAGNSSIYRGVINYQEDLRRTKLFEKGLNKIVSLVANKPLFILSHNPIDNWCSGDFIKSATYINGHNHHNDFKVNDNYRIYADAQVGYSSLNVVPKYFSFEYKWDYFSEYKDGIYEIKPREYERFCRGYAVPGSYGYKDTKLFMLKNSGYYMFVSQSNTSKKLCILNGGQRKSLSKKDINYYFNNLVIFAEAVKTDPIINMVQTRIKQVSDFVKMIGGDGRVHGTIIDIDFMSHIYVNIKDGSLTPYYAWSMVDKWTFPNLESLLEAHVPELLPNYRKMIGEQNNELVVVLGDESKRKRGLYVSDTSIYQNSRIMLKLQALLESNIVKIWEDSVLEEAIKKIESKLKIEKK